MVFSLLLMLASETYCRWSYSSMPTIATNLLCSQYVVFVGLIYSQISCVPVYKLVRFYDPDSSEEYLTTRATLTVFSKHLQLRFFNCTT